jgi:hypothetical protein
VCVGGRQIVTGGEEPWSAMEWSSFGKTSKLFTKEHDR